VDESKICISKDAQRPAGSQDIDDRNKKPNQTPALPSKADAADDDITRRLANAKPRVNESAKKAAEQEQHYQQDIQTADRTFKDFTSNQEIERQAAEQERRRAEQDKLASLRQVCISYRSEYDYHQGCDILCTEVARANGYPEGLYPTCRRGCEQQRDSTRRLTCTTINPNLRSAILAGLRRNNTADQRFGLPND
jgi:hypothetical protein